MRGARLAETGLFYCALVWGSTFFMVKGALEEVHPVSMVAYRFLISAACLAPWALRRRPSRLLKEGAALSALLVAMYLTQTVGLLWTSASNSGFITGTFILFVPVFLHLFFTERPTPAQWAAVALALAGLWLLTGGPRGFNAGDALTLLTAAAYAAHVLVVDRFVKGSADVVLLAFHQFWMTGVASFLFAWGAGFPFEVASRSGWGVIVFLALVPTLSAFFIQLVAQRKVPPVRAALIFTLEPVFAGVFAWTLGGEPFRFASAFGGGLIVGAMVLSEVSKLTLRKGREREILPV